MISKHTDNTHDGIGTHEHVAKCEPRSSTMAIIRQFSRAAFVIDASHQLVMISN